MSPKTWTIAFLALAAVALGGLWLRAHDRAVRNRVLAEARADSLQMLARETAALTDSAARATADRDSAEARLDRVRTREAALQDSLARVGEEAEVEAVAASDSLDATLARIREAASDRLRPLVEEAIRQHAEEREAHRSVAKALRAQITSRDRTVAAQDSTLRAFREEVQARERLEENLRERIAVLQTDRDFWREEANPGFLEGLVRDWPTIVGSAALGAAAWEFAR